MEEYDFRNVPDTMWKLIEPLVSGYKRIHSGGIPALSFRQILDGIIYKLKAGCQWSMIPREYGSKSTLHMWFSKWSSDGVMGTISQIMMQFYDSELGYGTNFQSMDGSIVPAPVRRGNSISEGLRGKSNR